jgi:hypothetical protein
MTKPHRLTPAQWESIERYAEDNVIYDACFLDLRDRIEALEAAQQPRAFTGKVVAPITRDRDETGDYLIVGGTPSPAGSLVKRVQQSIDDKAVGHEARAAILEVAAWMREQRDLIASTALTREANQ